MVKLAETRTKKKYNLVPRGKALYEDETRFGTKMLEKMGWTKGKGLGAREEGLKDFVHVRYKNDAEGLGYEARDDQWTQHQESFDGLLKSLTENTTGNATEECGENSDVENRGFGLGFSQPVENNNSNSLKAKISGQSLEERSKQSRARVHYKKFTRGKDLSQYSEKDLANIFGKKSFEDAVKPVESEDIESIEKSEKEVETFQSSTLSVNDYFKQKMEALKMKRSGLSADNEQINKVNAAEEVKETKEAQKEKKKKKKDKKEKVEKEVVVENDLAENSTKTKKLKKDKKQSKQEFIAENAQKMHINADVVETEKSSTALDKKTEELHEIAIKKPKKEKHKREREASINEEIAQADAKKFKLETEIPTTEKLLTKNKTKKLKKEFQLEDMLEFLQSSHIYRITTYCAERFRFADLAGFNGANISEIKGYDVPSNIQLQITKSSRDRQRVINLWSTKEFKTEEDPYKTYSKQVRQARKKSEKLPRLKTHKFAKRNAFKLVNI